MKERPILFSGPMVRAILDGRKAQTRRIVKIPASIQNPNWTGWSTLIDERGLVFYSPGSPCWKEHPPIKCPYGKPGDRLWVRETHWVSDCGQYLACPGIDSNSQHEYYIWARDGSRCWTGGPAVAAEFADPHQTIGWSRLRNATKAESRRNAFEMTFADCDPTIAIKAFTGNTILKKYEAVFRRRRSPIHMPRWASRITLEVANVRAERLHDISEADAEAEGIKRQSPPNLRGNAWHWGDPTQDRCSGPAEAYAALWESIHGPGSWQSNPHVWVVEFKRLESGKP